MRDPMKECLGIDQDKDIRNAKTKVDKDILRRFNNGEELEDWERPKAKPMRLDYAGGTKSSWNLAVWEAFVPFLLAREQKIQGPGYIPFHDEAHARSLFMKRILRLRRYLNDLKPRKLPDGKKESRQQVKERVARKDEVTRDEARDNTRRAEVLDTTMHKDESTLTAIYVGLSKSCGDHDGEHVQPRRVHRRGMEVSFRTRSSLGQRWCKLG